MDLERMSVMRGVVRGRPEVRSAGCSPEDWRSLDDVTLFRLCSWRSRNDPVVGTYKVDSSANIGAGEIESRPLPSSRRANVRTDIRLIKLRAG